MGKDWLYWGSGGGSSRSTKRGSLPREERNSKPSYGCMSAVLQLFDLQQFQPSNLHNQPFFKPESFLPEDSHVLKGVEAPRNSLELEKPHMEGDALSSTTKKEQNLTIKVGNIQIKTSTCGDTKSPRPSTSKPRTDDLSSEYSSSPGAKTPNLVARLMGLDLLPESSSPSLSSSTRSIQCLKQEIQSRKLLHGRSRSSRNFCDNDITDTCSLPETPRRSSGRRSDSDYHHRLSLQINKDNVALNQQFEFSGCLDRKYARKREIIQENHENTSPGHYARQIMKQVKENVGRKVGLDITNNFQARDFHRRDENLVLLKSKKLPFKETMNSCSPRLRLLDSKAKLVTESDCKNQTCQSPKFISSPFSSSIVKGSSKLKCQPPLEEQKNGVKKCKKISGPKRPPKSSEMIRNKKEEPFVSSSTAIKATLLDKKCKKTPLSNKLLNKDASSLLPLRKDPSPPATKIPHKQEQSSESISSKRNTQLSSCSSHSYDQQKQPHIIPTVPDNNSDDNTNWCATFSTVDESEFQYILSILKSTGINTNTPLSTPHLYSKLLPLDPSIFYHLEVHHRFTKQYSTMSQRCNRKLMFHLVDELLAEILRSQVGGSKLCEKLCEKIGGFPLADCRVLEDIDGLIDKDLSRTHLRKWVEFEEEGEILVSEIEGDILDNLVHEMAIEVFGGGLIIGELLSIT